MFRVHTLGYRIEFIRKERSKMYREYFARVLLRKIKFSAKSNLQGRACIGLERCVG